MRLDHYLVMVVQRTASEFAGLSRSRWHTLVKNGAVQLDGKIARPSHRLRGGEQLTIQIPELVPSSLVPVSMFLDVLYEDEHLLALNKPAGLTVHPGAGTRTPTLVHALLAHCRDLSGIGGTMRPGIVHRLDKDTSGILVVAKNDETHQFLAKQFADRQTDKDYVAIVLGNLRQRHGTVETFYGRHPKHRQRFTGKLSRGKRARTHFWLEHSACGLSLVKIRIDTGRTHQIRVHLSEMGHPVLGDKLYGGLVWQRITQPTLRTVAQKLSHQALHAASLRIRHPNGTWLHLSAEPPADFAEVWRAVELAARTR